MLRRVFDLQRLVGRDATVLQRLEAAIPVAISCFFFWAITVCYLRWRRLRALERISSRELLEYTTNLLRSQQGIDVLHQELKTPQCQASPLLRRLHAVVQQWQIHANRQDADLVLQQHVAYDEEAVHAGYSLIRTFVWALPVLGLIGTVLGISGAVGDFSHFLGSKIGNDAQAITEIKKNLVSVTGGLAFAFLITLHGLLTSLLTMLTASSLQTREEKLYATVQQGIVDTFLPALQEVAPESSAGTGAIDLETWRTSLQQIAASVLEAVGNTGIRLLEEMEARHATQREQMTQAMRAWGESLQHTAVSMLATVRESGTQLLKDIEAHNNAQREQMANTLAAWDQTIRQAASGVSATVLDAEMQMLRDLNTQLTAQHEQMAAWTQIWRQDLDTGTARLGEALGRAGAELAQAGHDFLHSLGEVRTGFSQLQATLASQLQAMSQQHTETMAMLVEHTRVMHTAADTLASLAQTATLAVQSEDAMQETLQQLREMHFDRLLGDVTAALEAQGREVHTAADALLQLTDRTGEVLGTQLALQEAAQQLREAGFDQAMAAFCDATAALATQAQELRETTNALRQLTAMTREALGAQVTLQEAMRQLHEVGFDQTLAGFRDSLVALGPVLEDFRKPHVWQRIPVDGNMRHAE
jgi:biopolymer transport protein ExbB/TolQ